MIIIFSIYYCFEQYIHTYILFLFTQSNFHPNSAYLAFAVKRLTAISLCSCKIQIGILLYVHIQTNKPRNFFEYNTTYSLYHEHSKIILIMNYLKSQNIFAANNSSVAQLTGQSRDLNTERALAFTAHPLYKLQNSKEKVSIHFELST